MKTLVVYDSTHGNTEKVARAIGEVLSAVATLEVAEVGLDRLEGLDCLVVGCPTIALQPSPAMKGFLKRLPGGCLTGVKTAAFDTRLDIHKTSSGLLRFMMRTFGYAAESIASRLAKKGGTRATSPAGFIVEGAEGPLGPGELERAAVWARGIVTG